MNAYGINVFEPCYGWATEYGKCMGVFNYIFSDVDNYQWLLRSSASDPDHVRAYNSCYRSYNAEMAAGIRPGLWIDLDKLLNLKNSLEDTLLLSTKHTPMNNKSTPNIIFIPSISI